MPHFIFYIVGGIIILTILAYFLQEKFIFKPEKLKADFKFKYDIPFREYFFDVEPGFRINGLHFYREKPKGLILYFHGNTRSIKGRRKTPVTFIAMIMMCCLLIIAVLAKVPAGRTKKKCSLTCSLSITVHTFYISTFSIHAFYIQHSTFNIQHLT